MPSLRDQLQNLQEPVSRSFGVEKERASLLFDRKEAAAFSSEEFYNLGLAGLEQLRKVDRSLADYEEKLFDKSSIILNRAMLSKEENNELNDSLDRMIIYLSPYFNHQGCKQVLEWLIHKYHIHLYNATTIINAFIVYHSTNSFGRLLKILKIDRPEWEFAQEFSKKALPVPFLSILKACLKGGANHFLVASYSAFLQQAIQLVGAEYVGERMQMHFTFFASIVVHLFEDIANITEQLISRIIPYVGAALKSKVLPFKFSGFMIVCDLVMNTSLNEETLMNILKLTMLKMREEWFEVAMNVIFVICQRQNIKTLPKKVLLKLLRRGDALNLEQYLADMLLNFDMTGFTIPFVNTAFECLAEEEDVETQNLIVSYLKVVLNLEIMNDAQASATIHACLESLLVDENGHVPENLRLLLKQIVIRFVKPFDAIRAEKLITDKEALERLITQCEIKEHEVGVLTFEDKRKRRRRSSQSRNYDDEAVEIDASEPVERVEKVPKKETQLKNLQEGGDVQKAFKKAPSVVLDYLKSEEIPTGKLEWSLSAFESDKYLAMQTSDELEDFLVEIVRFISKNPQSKHKALLKNALLKIKVSDKILMSLIMPHEEESKAKRGRYSKTTTASSPFANETDPEFEARLIFVLDLLDSSAAIKATKSFLRHLFEMIEIADKPPKGYSTIKNLIYVQQLVLSLVAKILKEQDANSLVDKQMNFTSLVNVIQFTHDTSVLRNALKVLICVAPLIPTQLTTQIMSLFTFMGDGLLKKDNELTLTVVEEALHALFSAILAAVASQPVQYQTRLLEVSEIFAKTLPDIPVHRRSRLLKTLATCVQPDYLWIIFAAIFDNLCVNWKKDKSKNDSGNSLSNSCSDFISTLQPEQQIQFALKTLEYVVSLGGDAIINSFTSGRRFPLIFDRKAQTNHKLRHYRYMVIGFVLQILVKKTLPEQLSELTNNEIYERLTPFGSHIIEVMALVEDFVAHELSIAGKNEQAARGKESAAAQVQTLKYWVALSARSESIFKKFRELLPDVVRVRVVKKLVEDDEVDEKLRERAPKLFNVQLKSEEDVKIADQEPESFEDQLNNLIEKLNASLTIPTELAGLSSNLETLLNLPDAAERIEELAPQMFPLFFDLFAVRQRTYKDANPDDIQNCELAISRAFMTLSENLSEEDLKPVFSQLSDWIEEALKPSSKLKLRHRVLTVYNFANKFYEQYNNLALAYFSQLFVYTPKILKQLNVAKIDPDELFIDGTSDENSNRQVVDQLITSVIDFINNCAKHSFFMGDDRAELVYESVLDEIENRKVVGHKKRCLDHLVDCIYHLSESAPDLFTTSLCGKLLDKMQNPSSRVRLQATVIFEKLVTRIGDALAPLLPTIVQYLSELIDDSDAKVAEQCDATIRQLRHVFGDDILNDR